MIHQRPIRTQLLVLLAAATLPLVALWAHTVYAEYRSSISAAEQAVLALAEANAIHLGRFVEDVEAVLSELARRHTGGRLSEVECHARLTEARDLSPAIAEAIEVGPDGELLCTSAAVLGPGRHAPNADRAELLDRVRRTGQIQYSAPVIGSVTGSPATVIMVPVVGEDGEFAGAAGASVRLSRLQTLLTPATLPEGALVTVTRTDDGTVMARSVDPDEWVGTAILTGDITEETMLRGPGLNRTTGVDGIDRLWGFAPIPGPRWAIFVGVPTEGVHGPVRAAAIQRGAVSLLILLLAVILAGLLYHTISSSVVSLTADARAAAGERGRRIRPRGPRELEELAREFNRTLTAREEAELEVLQAERRYRSILENAVLGVFLATPDGRIVEANPALARMLGYASESELPDLLDTELFVDREERDRIYEAIGSRERRIQGYEVRLRDRNGVSLPVRLSATRIRVGESAFSVVLVEDIREEESMRRRLLQSRRMEAVGHLAAGVAHDFNNLLTVIQGEASFLEEEIPEGKPGREGLEAIRGAAGRAARLVSQLLAFSRQDRIERLPLDIGREVGELEEALRAEAGPAVHLELSLAPDVPLALMDRGHLEEVLRNLVRNARDAMPDGGRLAIAVDAERPRDEEADGEASEGAPAAGVVLRVSDTGKGMPPETLERIFDPFFTTKPPGEATGLGLATVYGIVTGADGRIDVDSEPGRGTTVTISFPGVEPASSVSG